MITIRRQLLGLGLVAASSLFALNSAHALSGPTAITIDGGPLGSLNLSGGVDGYGYYQSGTSRTVVDGEIVTNPIVGDKSNGAYVANTLVELQKTTGQLQFTIEIGSNGGAVTLGASHPTQTSINIYSTGPLYAGYLTLAPNSVPGLTISAGQLPSLEGWESGVDWNNANQLTTDIFFVQNSQNRGVEVAYTKGPISVSGIFGDGFDTGVWNMIQLLGTYTINSTNSVSAYYTGNLSRTGLNAITYGGTPVGAAPFLVNSQLFGGWYNYTTGNLNLVPEVQYVYAKPDAKLRIMKTTSNFGAAVFADYSFGTSPYSLGGWVEYEKSQGEGDWFAGANSEAIGISVSPTWQYKDLFARADAGGLYLLNNKDFSNESYGNSPYTGKAVFTGLLEAGLLF
jgi:hypothetical protein